MLLAKLQLLLDDIDSSAAAVSRTNYMTIAFLSNFMSEEQAKISKNPAIFETEPKEDIDLDIFYEASNNQAIFPITNDNKYVYLPIGSTIIPPVNSSFPNGIFVSGWGDIIPYIALGYGTYISLTTNKSHSSFDSTIRNVVRFIREDGSFATATMQRPVIATTNASGSIIGFNINPNK
jgi:hypothetical protein